MSRIRLTWNNASTTIVEQRVYRSISPLDIDDMPTPLAVLPRRNREYLDSTIEDGLAYYYAVSSVLPDYSELISKEIKVEATPGESDPYWDKVVALLHFDGSLTKNEAGSDFTAYGAPALVQGKFGEAIFADYNYGVLSQHSDFIFGSADFTIECFWKPLGINRTVFSFNVLGSSAHSVWQSGTGLSFWSGGSNLIASNQVATSDIYHHIAFVRSENVSYLFLDGVLIGSAPYSTNLTGNGIRTGNTNNVNPAGGAIDELRITKGVARYTENFTPPTEPFPNN